MNQYHKIQTVYFRDPDNHHKTLLDGAWSKPEFEALKDINWVCTEKIDGTNIRVMWNGFKITVGGKTDRAQIPVFLVEFLYGAFNNQAMFDKFGGEHQDVCLYGEGYGARIQKGGRRYIPDGVSFILFDVKIGNWWLRREDVEEIAHDLNIDIVPIVGVMKIKEAVEYVKDGFISTVSDDKEYIAEGLVIKPCVELFNRQGHRIISKVKYKDFRR